MPVTTGFSEPGYRYQLILRGECGPLTAWLFGDAAIESGGGCTSVAFSARDDSDLYGLLDRIQDVAFHLISLNQIGGSSPATALTVTDGLDGFLEARILLRWVRGTLTLPRDQALSGSAGHVLRPGPTCYRRLISASLLQTPVVAGPTSWW
jgi:hypothetical protein